MNCEHCNNILQTISSLKYHKLNNKKCIKIQEDNKKCIKIQEDNTNIFSCTVCLKIFSTKNSLNRHICINTELKIKLENYRIELETKKNENKEMSDNLEKAYIHIELENKEMSDNLEKADIHIKLKNKEISDNLEKYRKELELKNKEISDNLEKADIHIERLENKLTDITLCLANRTTTNNNNTHNINNYNLIPLDIVQQNNIKDVVENYYNLEYQMDGQKGLAKLLSDSGVLKPKGENIYICSDFSRGIFKYKNENGIEIRDVQAKDLTTWVHAIALKNIKRELLQQVDDFIDHRRSPKRSFTLQPSDSSVSVEDNGINLEHNKLINSHSSISSMNDDNKEFVKALGICI